MNIWLIKISEPLPIDGADVRLGRIGLIAKELIKRGHNITWFASDYDHFRQVSRFRRDKNIQLVKNYQLRLLSAVAYKKTVSFRRLINHIVIAKKFIKDAQSLLLPDIILCALPSIELSYEAVKLAKKHKIPIIIDLRDMWPDIFLDRTKGIMKCLVKPWVSQLKRKMNYICGNATALFGITEGFLEWGLQYAKRKKSNLDGVFSLAYSSEKPNEKVIKEAENFWASLGLSADQFVVCYVGSFRPIMEIETLIKAVMPLDIPYKLVIAGAGDGNRVKAYKKIAKGNNNIIFSGWINKPQIQVLLKMSQVGLAPYRSSRDFVISIPNKPIEYFSAGLPVVSSLKGELAKLLEIKQCGCTYENNDVEALRKILLKLFNDKALRMKISENARALYQERFVAERVYSDMIDRLERIVKSKEEQNEQN